MLFVFCFQGKNDDVILSCCLHYCDEAVDRYSSSESFLLFFCSFEHIFGETNHQCSKQRSSGKKKRCDHAQKAYLVCRKNVGGESNHSTIKDQQRNKEIFSYADLL